MTNDRTNWPVTHTDSLPDRIRSAMHMRGVGLRALAGRMRSDESTIRRWIEGRLPRADKLRELAVALEVSADWLLGIDGRYGAPQPVRDEQDGWLP